ncbi:unnamed protein product [Ambrosiozyma monospora]|uniref:Unnamed protein product n=1 Tax=Ambrosiozyma monospora TaxID=43982 RepID=A0ACB5T7X6_AMBMO|nr:unnamed protein product [Ambrosiozyma monospora]
MSQDMEPGYPDLKIEPAVDQIELHPWLQQTELVEYLKSQGIAVEAYSPLVQAKKLDNPTVVELQEKYGKSYAQILIAWSLAKGYIPLPKTVTESRLVPNLESADIKLSDEDIKKLDDIPKSDPYVSGWDPTVYPLDDEKK